MGFWKHIAHRLGCLAGVHEIVDQQPLLAVHFKGFENFHIAALVLPVVAAHANGFHQADVQLASHDGGRHQPATGDGDDTLEVVAVQQSPGQGSGVPVQLIPGNGKHSLSFRFFCHVVYSFINH